MKCYEIQTYKDATWHIDSVFDDAEIALHEARRMDESKRYQVIRVIEEHYDEITASTNTRTIFRGGRMAAEARARRVSAPAPKAAPAPPRASVGREPVRKGGRAPSAPQETSVTMPLILGTLVILGGGAALVALHYFSQMQ